MISHVKKLEHSGDPLGPSRSLLVELGEEGGVARKRAIVEDSRDHLRREEAEKRPVSERCGSVSSCLAADVGCV
jgi:hypothetical protein